jgi:hypothetical protein
MADAADLASSLNSTKCYLEKVVPPAKTPSRIELEETDPQNVKDFFADRTTGYFLLFSKGHVVVVADGTVHEFALSKNGYDATAVLDWLKPYNKMKLTVRQLSSKPAMAT